MNYFIGITGIAILIWLVVELQKWRKIVIRSVSPFDSPGQARRNKMKTFMIDFFSLGLIFVTIVIALIVFDVIQA